MTSQPPASPSPRRVLVTGASGQDGSYLVEQLVTEGCTVFGLARPRSSVTVAGVLPVEGDLRDAESLRRAVETARPDEVYHLAAVTFVPDSWTSREEVDDINVAGLERLTKALVATGAPFRLCHASSAEIFGEGTGRPFREDDPLAPRSPYGESKARAHRHVETLREREGVFACSAILFNHESPRRPARFVTRKITMAAARIARGLQDSVELGNLDAARDWGYAPEYTAAMRQMIRTDVARDYVVATGRATTVGEFARLAFERVGLDWQRHVRSDAGLQRYESNAPRVGDASRIALELGWKAATTVENLVAMMVDADLALLDA